MKAHESAKAAVEGFSSHVVEKRGHHVSVGYVASDISDVIDCLLRNFGFRSRL